MNKMKSEDFTEKNIYQFNARRQYEQEKVTQKELLKQKLHDIQFLEEQVDKIMYNQEMRHFLSHYDIVNCSFTCPPNGYTFHPTYENKPYKNNYSCNKCNEIVTDLNKYQMVYEFLKKKIGPDCSRLVTFRTLNMDKDNAEKKPIETYKYEITKYMLADKNFNDFRKMYNECNLQFNVGIELRTKDNKSVYFHL